MSKLWQGRLSGGLDPFFEDFNRSLGFDRRLLTADLRGSKAWARALGGAGVLDSEEVLALVAALDRIELDVAAHPAQVDDSDAEDVHSWVEARLGDEVGELAQKLHTGRSRNDQVATDFKLYLDEAASRILERMTDLVQAFVELGEQHADLPLPGYTHLQRAQPVTVGHHALAYVEMLGRDRTRFEDALVRMDTCPLGAGALAGTGFAVDREALAAELGFTGGPTRNSLDAVGDRDHACELLFAASMTMLHLSRLAEDWIFFASQEAGLLQFDDAVATGSSLMPQKKNPDAMELLRGKCGRVLGHLNGLMITLKGLPLAYDKDLQEDKEACFDALDTLEACLRVAATAVRHAHYQPDACLAAAGTGYLNATDLADLLVGRGVPFRAAHERVGRAVRHALEQGVELQDLPAEQLAELLPELEAEVGFDLAAELSTARVLARRDVIGGTAPARVRAELQSWKERLASWQA